MKKYIHILKECPLFFGIDEASLEKMLSCMGARVEFFDKKYTVMSEGTPAKHLGILLSGSVQVMRVDYYGNRSILSEVTAPHIFGEAFACAELEKMPVTVVAGEPSEIMLIGSEHILHTCERGCAFHKQLIYNLMKDLATKVLVCHNKIEVTSCRSTGEKLMTYLLAQAKRMGTNSFEIPFDRQELADYLEVDRSGLSSEISKLKKAGVIDCRKNRFELL